MTGGGLAMQELRRFADAGVFYEQVAGFLLEHEAVHNLILGILDTLTHYPERYPDPLLLIALQEEQVQAVALQTPPHNLLLSRAKTMKVIELLVQELKEARLPGVAGPSQEAKAFAERWRQETGQDYTLGMAQRIYRLEKVNLPPPVTGHLRQAAVTDKDLLISWTRAFTEEAMPGTIQRSTESIVEQRLQDGSL